MSDYLKWYLCHRWLIKFAVKDWMTADANKLKQRKDYYYARMGNDSNLLIVFYVQIMPDDFVMQLHRF